MADATCRCLVQTAETSSCRANIVARYPPGRTRCGSLRTPTSQCQVVTSVGAPECARSLGNWTTLPKADLTQRADTENENRRRIDAYYAAVVVEWNRG